MECSINKKNKSTCLKFLLACYFLYTISICIKMVYSAEMAEIILAVGSTKSAVSLGLLLYYVAYFISQLIFAFLINKINLKWFITISVSLSAISFALMLWTSELWHLYVILFLNGIFQTGIWGGIMYFVGKYVPKEMSGFASKFLTTGFAIGTALTYGVAALCIAVLDWRYTFLCFSILTIASIVIFLFSLKHIEKNLGAADNNKDQNEIKLIEQPLPVKNKGGIKRVIILVTFFTLVASLMACVYYAVMGWFPNLLIEEFNMPTEYSILITLLLPLSMTPGSFLIVGLNEKSKSDFNVSLIFSIISTILVIVWTFTFSINIILTILIAVVMLFCVRALISLLCAYVPLRYRDRVEVGKFSLILNAFAALMGGVMPYLISFVLENSGWNMYFILLSILSVIFTGLLLIVRIREYIKNKQFKNEQGEKKL